MPHEVMDVGKHAYHQPAVLQRRDAYRRVALDARQRRPLRELHDPRHGRQRGGDRPDGVAPLQEVGRGRLEERQPHVVRHLRDLLHRPGHRRRHDLLRRGRVHECELRARVLGDAVQPPALALADHRDGGALLPRAARAAGAVHEGLAVLRELEVHHQVDVGDVQAARRDVCRDEHTEDPVAEVLHHLLPGRLRDVAVQRLACDTLLEPVVQLVHAQLGLREADRLLALRVHRHEVHHHLAPLLVVGHDREARHALGNLFAAVAHEVYRLRVNEVVVSHIPHPVRERRAKHMRLPLRRALVEDAFHLFLEPLLQHLVRLVQHQVLHVPEHQSPGVQQVVDPPRRANDDIRALLQLTQTDPLGGAAVAAQHLERRHRGLFELALHLHRELARGAEHESARGAPAEVLLRGRVHVELLDHGDGEGERLARARPRAADEVPAAHSVVPHSRLDGEEGGYAAPLEGVLRPPGHVVLADWLARLALGAGCDAVAGALDQLLVNAAR
mmetsp:Transcript_7565/g.26635  ORF Transcript_7565/g.26635 Transcript_7565/m.26635 type:complete len:501 (-) Transcript_7565:161-1663(-)